MPDLFKEIIPSILEKKKNVFEDDYRDYKPWVINRAISYHLDCVLYANEMNLYPNIDADMQYQYLLNTIRPMKRKFQPWQKAGLDKNIEAIKKFFGYSDQKAREIFDILTQDQIDEIRRITEKVGVKNS